MNYMFNFIRNCQLFPLCLYHTLPLSIAAKHLTSWVDYNLFNHSLLFGIKLFPITYYYKQFGNEHHYICSFVHMYESICRITFIGRLKSVYVVIFNKFCQLVLHICYYQHHFYQQSMKVLLSPHFCQSYR